MSDPKPPTVVEVMAQVMDEVRAVHKGDHNDQQGFSFRGVDSVVNAVAPALRRHGVIVVPKLKSITHGEVAVGRNRTPMGHVLVEVTYRFHGPQGDFIEADVPGEAMDSGDKAVAKAMSVAYRICLLQALCLPTDEIDPDHLAYQRTPPPTPEEIDTWAEGVSGQIAEATEPDRLRELWMETVNHRHASGVLKERLKGELTARSAELGL